jgi:hypothetical protein
MKGEPVYICAGAHTPIGRYAGALSADRGDPYAGDVVRGRGACPGIALSGAGTGNGS